MTELVFLKGKQALTTSLKVAEVFGKRHDNVLQAIETAQNNLLNFKDVEKAIIKSEYVDAKGERRPMYLLNRDGFTFVAMGFTGAKATEFKWNYIRAFNAMEAALAERNSAEWREVRSATKDGYKELSVAVKELYEFAKAHGCNVSERVFYMNFAKLMNKTLGISPGTRDDLATWQLYEVEKLQFIARTIIAGLIAGGADYHLPYKNCKAAFEAYARLSYINERLLLARGLSD